MQLASPLNEQTKHDINRVLLRFVCPSCDFICLRRSVCSLKISGGRTCSSCVAPPTVESTLESST